jgi:hypothetical protein
MGRSSRAPFDGRFSRLRVKRHAQRQLKWLETKTDNNKILDQRVVEPLVELSQAVFIVLVFGI